MSEEIGELVRRVVGRALSERGRLPEGGAARRPVGGVHVHGSVTRPGASRPPGAGAPVAAADLERRRALELVPTTPSGAGRRLVVAVGADHGGFGRKGEVLAWIAEWGHVAHDLGTRDTTPVDYPDFAAAVARAVAEGRADLGVCIDGMGIGSSIAANKVPGARAATCWDEASARNAREHNFANVLALGAAALDAPAAHAVLWAFITTAEGAERHARRVGKIAELERRATGRALPVRRVRPGGEEAAR